MWFAKWNLEKYYSYAAADLTATTSKLITPTTGSLTDEKGPSEWNTLDARLKAIDTTLSIG
ncbi:MAG: hypothetical protein ACK521_00010 [bacterium]